jgi:hypothetical protein
MLTAAKIKKIKSISISYRKGFLSGRPSDGMCWALSTALQGFLSYAGYNTDLVQGKVIGMDYENHFWLEYSGVIIDPTADQCGMKDKVYIGKLPDNYIVLMKYKGI